jgi:hypothetical protein
LTIREDEFGHEALRLMTLNDMPSIMALNKNNATARYVSGGDLIREERNEIEDGMIVEKGLWACPFGK